MRPRVQERGCAEPARHVASRRAAPFPIFLGLDGARVLLIGSDAAKEALLRRAGARVERVDPAAFAPGSLDCSSAILRKRRNVSCST